MTRGKYSESLFVVPIQSKSSELKDVAHTLLAIVKDAKDAKDAKEMPRSDS